MEYIEPTIRGPIDQLEAPTDMTHYYRLLLTHLRGLCWPITGLFWHRQVRKRHIYWHQYCRIILKGLTGFLQWTDFERFEFVLTHKIWDHNFFPYASKQLLRSLCFQENCNNKEYIANCVRKNEFRSAKISSWNTPVQFKNGQNRIVRVHW